MIKKWRKKRAGKWVAEDRLRGALFGATLVPFTTCLFGIANAYIDGNAGLAVCMGILFVNGVGVGSPEYCDRGCRPTDC